MAVAKATCCAYFLCKENVKTPICGCEFSIKRHVHTRVKFACVSVTGKAGKWSRFILPELNNLYDQQPCCREHKQAWTQPTKILKEHLLEYSYCICIM